MKEFLKGIATLVGALIITIIYLPVGLPYTYLHALYYWIKGRKFKNFFQLIARQIDGTLAVVGYVFYHLAIALDMLWNVNGEFIEDLTTTTEHTSFGEKNITVSTATGEQEILGLQKPLGKKFNIWLNWLFGQKSHATDSYQLHLKEQELKRKYFQ